MPKKRIFQVLSFSILFTILITIFPINTTYAQTLEEYEKILEMTSEDKEFALNRFIVKYKDSTSTSEMNRSITSKNDLSTSLIKNKNLSRYKTISLTQQDDMANNNVNSSDQATAEKLRSKMLVYALDSNVEYVEPVYAYHASWTDDDPQATPDDWDDTNHWYYEKENVREMWHDQDCHGVGADCGGDSDVVVAVIDTGLAFESRTAGYKQMYTGEPLTPTYGIAGEMNGINLYTNTGEVAGNNTDDDGNGVVDDVNGYNAFEHWVCYYFDNDGTPGNECTAAQRAEAGHPNDDWGHGTFVTGLIASLTDNAVGSTSVSPAHNITIMPIKAAERITHADTPQTYGPNFWTDDLCNALYYATMMDADVINMSLGSSYYSQTLEEYINYAYSAGITIVAASGNDNSSVDYPARYTNVIAVGASDSDDNKASYSNYGSELDLVAAVGDGGAGNVAYQQSYSASWGGSCTNSSCTNAYSCELTNYCDEFPLITNSTTCTNYGYEWKTDGCNSTWNFDDYTDFAYPTEKNTGTSYASPQVAAGAALVKTRFPSLKPAEVRNILNRTATDISSAGWDQQTGYGNLNFEDLWNQGYLTQPSHWRDDFGKRGDQWFVGNFNGDSYDDIALVRDNGTNTQTWWVALSNGSSFNTVTQWRSDFGNRGDHWYVGNFNGDSYDDIALVRDNGIHIQTLWVALSNGSSFNTVSQWRDDFGKRGDQWYVGNFNGDSYDDIALVRDNSSSIQTWWVALSNGSSFNTVSQWRDDFGKRGDQWYVGNFNGDSYDDIALVRDNGTYTQTWWVTLSDGASFDAVATWASDFGNRGDHWYVGDFNGDTYDDISLVRDNTSSMQSWWMAISDGNDFNDISSWRNDFGNRGNQWFIGEFDNDNLSDVAVVIDASPSIQTWWVIFGTL